jgi:hypothetical protein
MTVWVQIWQIIRIYIRHVIIGWAVECIIVDWIQISTNGQLWIFAGTIRIKLRVVVRKGIIERRISLITLIVIVT